MAKPPEDSFFVGWSSRTPTPDRRFLIVASLALLAAGGGVGAMLGRAGLPPGPGGWDQGDMRDWTGLLVRAPYPALRFRDDAGRVRTALIGSSGKLSVHARLPPRLAGAVTVRASPIVRGDNLMLAAADDAGWLRPATADIDLPPPQETPLGAVARIGEILDAKCWFGAMRPGFGKTHKSCAALCARGRLPLAFCTRSDCGEGLEAALFLDADGQPHGPGVLPFLADPVVATGQLVRIDDIVQFRVGAADIRRI